MKSSGGSFALIEKVNVRLFGEVADASGCVILNISFFIHVENTIFAGSACMFASEVLFHTM